MKKNYRHDNERQNYGDINASRKQQILRQGHQNVSVTKLQCTCLCPQHVSNCDVGGYVQVVYKDDQEETTVEIVCSNNSGATCAM